MAANGVWTSGGKTRRFRMFRRVPALLVGAVLGWMLADLMLLRGADPKAVARPVAKKAATKTLSASIKFTKFPDWVGAVAAASDNRTIAAGSLEVVKLFDLVDRKETASLPVESGMVQAVAFSPDGKVLAAGTYQDVIVWNVTDRKKLLSLPGHRGQVTAVAFSPDGSLIATGCEDEVVRVFDAATGSEKNALEGHQQPVTGVAFLDNQRLVSVGSDLTRASKKGALKVWDVASGNELQSHEPHDKALSNVAASSDGKWLATTSLDETVKVLSAADGKVSMEYGEHTRTVNAVVFLPTGKHLASASGGRNAGNNEAHVWNLQGKTEAVLEGHEGPVVHLAATPDGTKVITASRDKTVLVYDVASLLGISNPAPAVAAAEPAKPDAAKLEAKAEAQADKPDEAKKELKAGIIGLDTSHVIAFTNLLNAKEPKPALAGCRMVAAYPKGSPDIESSVVRVPEYTEKVKAQGVEIVDSIDALVSKVDVVFLETNDGRPHLEQVLPVLKAGKPVFIDKPIAGSLTDAVAIFELGKKYKTPLFSSSSLRFSPGAQAIRGGKIGDVLGADAYSPCSLEKTHPDLFWYGIHGVESLFTVMGTGCESAARASTADFEVVTGVWTGGRIGTFRGLRAKGASGYGGTAFGTKGIAPIGDYGGYEPLIVEIVKFFKTGVAPVSEEETLQIYAFMEAADESKRQGGVPVKLETVLAKAREEAARKIESLK